MEKPLVSVVMPTYNQASFISEAIESVLSQTYANIELIIIDNYSNDRTEEVVKSFNDQRIQYYKRVNKGIIASSRNFGIRNAKGQYIAFLDSDDAWYPRKLEKQINAFNKNDKAGISFSRVDVKSKGTFDKNRIMGPKQSSLEGFIYDMLFMNNIIISSSVVVKRRVLDDVGLFDERKEFVCVEDFDLWLRIVRKYEVAFVAEVLGSYRKHDNNKSFKDEDLLRVQVVVDKHLNEGWVEQKLANKALASFCFLKGWILIESDRVSARKLFKKSLTFKNKSLKIYILSFLGSVLSYAPYLFRFIRRNRIDSKFNSFVLES